jgi:hypothetical protein
MLAGLGRIRHPLTHTPAIVMALALVAGCAAEEPTAPATSSTAQSASSAATQTASASTSATAAPSLDADHIFGADVSGYAFVELPKSLERQARRQFEATAGIGEAGAKLDLRSLTRGGTGTGVVLVVTLSAEYAALPGTERGFAVGIAQSAGTEPDDIELGATDGYVVDNDGQTIVAWQDHNLLIAVFAEQRASAIDAARAIVLATA